MSDQKLRYHDYKFLNKQTTGKAIEDFEAFWTRLEFSPPGLATGAYIKEVCKEIAQQAYLQALKDSRNTKP